MINFTVYVDSQSLNAAVPILVRPTRPMQAWLRPTRARTSCASLGAAASTSTDHEAEVTETAEGDRQDVEGGDREGGGRRA